MLLRAYLPDLPVHAFKQGEPPTLFLRGFRPPQGPPPPLPGPQLSQCQLGERSTGLASVTSPQRQDSPGSPSSFWGGQDRPGSHLPACSREGDLCLVYGQLSEQARK